LNNRANPNGPAYRTSRFEEGGNETLPQQAVVLRQLNRSANQADLMNLRTPHPFGGSENRKPFRLLRDRHSRQPELIQFAGLISRVHLSTHQVIGHQDDFSRQCT
jgi:hypothetical protein